MAHLVVFRQPLSFLWHDGALSGASGQQFRGHHFYPTSFTSSITSYWPRPVTLEAGKIIVGLAESNGSLLLGLLLNVGW